MEMVFLEAEMIEARKFRLKQHDVGCEAWTDESWSLKLAKLSHSWVVTVCILGPVEGAMDVFDIESKTTFNKTDLEVLARKMKEQELALRAATVALGTSKKRKRNPDRRPNRGARRRPREESEEESWHLSDSDADAAVADPEPFVEAEVLPQPDADEERPSELPAGVPDLGVAPPPPPHPARRKVSRALPWGPFQLAPIVPASGHSGWGAICGLHRDQDGSKTTCKKAITLNPAAGLDDSECILRLKRWLLAGVSDEGWPQHKKRTHHVKEIGGPQLSNFAEGMSEAQLDAAVARMA